MLNWLFSASWLIDLPGPHFNTLCFSVPSHHLLLKTNSQYLSGSPIKDLHCDSIFHFNYYTYCTLDVFPYLSNNAKGWNSSSKQIVRFSNCSFQFGCARKKTSAEQLNHFFSVKRRCCTSLAKKKKPWKEESVAKILLTVSEPDFYTFTLNAYR